MWLFEEHSGAHSRCLNKDKAKTCLQHKITTYKFQLHSHRIFIMIQQGCSNDSIDVCWEIVVFQRKIVRHQLT